MQLRVSTTGTSATVVINDLGGRTLVHPVVDLNLAVEFNPEELVRSSDLQAALDNGEITAIDADGRPIDIVATAFGVPEAVGEEGVIKINNIVTALLVTDGTTYTIDPATPLVFSTATRFPLRISDQFPGQTPQANEAAFRPFIFDTVNNKWLENSKNMQVHLWRINLKYTRAATTTNRQIIATLNNPISGFTLQRAFTMPNSAAFQTFEVQFVFITIADSASIGLGYLLTLRPEGDNITINDLDVTRTSLAVL